MDLNPLSVIEKWIVEHASAAVLDKHVAFVREQLVALEKQKAVLADQNAVLVAERSVLANRIKELEIEVRDGKEALQVMAEQIRHQQQAPERQPPEQELLLQLIASRNDQETGQLAQMANMDRITVEHHLEELRKVSFIIRDPLQEEPTWRVRPDGIAYLVKHKLTPKQ